MAVPLTNTTCDIYRSGNAPPKAPDVAGVKVFLCPQGSTTLTTGQYTHVLYCDVGVDVRDGFTGGGTWQGTGADSVHVPDQNGTAFGVVLVRRVGWGTPADRLEVLLMRSGGLAVPWPTSNL